MHSVVSQGVHHAGSGRCKSKFDRFRAGFVLIPAVVLMITPGSIHAQKEGGSAKTGIQKRTSAGRGGGGGYSLYVPTTYDGSQPLPLILVLPSVGNSDTDFIKRDEEALPKLAESRGYLVAVAGSPRSRYGMWTKSENPAIRAGARADEERVLKILSAVKDEFEVKEKGVFILGHSTGGAAAMFLATKHPELWAGVACISAGWGDEESLKSMKQIPVITIIGDNDAPRAITRMRQLSDDIRSAGIEYAHEEIEGADKDTAVAPGIAKALEFFDRQMK